MSFAKWMLPGLMAALVAVPALANSDSEAKRLAQFEQFAGEPVPQIRYFQLINFETLSNDTIAVWKGVNRVFLIKVRPPCMGLLFANTLQLTNSGTHLFTQRYDHVIFDDQRCDVAWIKPVDYKAMRAAQKAAKDQAAQ